MQGTTAIRKCETNGSHVDNVEIAASSDIVFINTPSVFILCLIARSLRHLPVRFGQVVSERNTSLLFTGELDNGHFDALLPVEGNER
jgi:hypothetical protein